MDIFADLKDAMTPKPVQPLPITKTVKEYTQDGITITLGKVKFRQYQITVRSKEGFFIAGNSTSKKRATNTFNHYKKEFFTHKNFKFETISNMKSLLTMEVTPDTDGAETKVVNIKKNAK